MSSSDELDPNDPVFRYLTAPPPPRSRIETRDIDAALAELDEAAATATAADSQGRRWVPGLSIVVVGRGSDDTSAVLYCKGHGTTSIDHPASVGPDTLFPCASLSKPVSTTLLVAAGVRENGGWDRVLVQPGTQEPYHLANSPASRTTLRQWLSHRSGLPDHGGDLIEDMHPAMTRHDLIDRVMKYQTDVAPGLFRYTNCGFTIGCLGAAHALGGADWETFAAHGLSALGMRRSTYTFTSAYDDRADRAFPHRGQPDVPELVKRQSTGWTWRVVDRDHERNPTRQAPAGSLLSSARDLGQFLSAHLSRRFGDFPPRNPPPEDTKDRSYSLGWNVGNHTDDRIFTDLGERAVNAISFSHSGAFSLGAGTFLRFDPDAGVGIAILSNGEPTGVPEALAQIFFKHVYGQPMSAGCDHATLFALCRTLMMAALYDRKIANYQRYDSKRSAIPDGVPPGEIFRGHSDYYDCDIAIEHQDGDLFLSMGNGPRGEAFWRFSLWCVDADTSTYVYATTGENEVGLSAIRLEWAGTIVVKVVDDWLNGSGPGEKGTGLGDIGRQTSASPS